MNRDLLLKERICSLGRKFFPLKVDSHGKWRQICNGRVVILVTFSPKAAVWPRGYKTFFMLCSAEHEILKARKYGNYQEIQHFSGSDKPRMLFFLLINVKMPTIVGI